MTIKIISGGQSGADLGGLVAAERYGLIGEFGGWMPRGWLTEDGPKPEYEARFRMRECRQPVGDKPPGIKQWEWEARCYRERTDENVMSADITLIFGDATTRGSRAVIKTEKDINDGFRPPPILIFSYDVCPMWVVEKLNLVQPRTINVAGNRESKAKDIGAWVERYLSEVFELLGYKEIASS